MNTPTARPLRKLQIVVAILMALVLTSISLQPSEAQTGPETTWDESGQVIVGENEPASVSILAAPTTPGTHYRTYSGIAFRPTSTLLTYSSVGAAIYVTSNPQTGDTLFLEMQLPQGATITEVVFYFRDYHISSDLGFSVRSYAPDSANEMVWESASSTGESPDQKNIIIPVNPPIIVDNTTTTYRLQVATVVAKADHILYGARVGFTTPTTYLPFLER